MPEDAKLRVIAKRSGQLMTHVVTVWLCVLDAASRHKTRGTVEVDSEQIAVVQEIDQRIVESILHTFYEKGMISEDHRLVGWDKRQYATDAERAKKYRDGKKQSDTESNAASRGVTNGNAKTHKNDKSAPDTDSRVQTTDSDTENRKTDKKSRKREEKRESEREKQQISGKTQNKILAEMLDIWNEHVQSKLTRGHKAILTPKRKQLITERWLEDFQQDMRAWRYYCEVIGNSDFCLGKLEGKGWTIDLTWAVESSEHVAKILEGGFSGGKHPSKPSVCHVPELKDAWDQVLAAFAEKHTSQACRSWLGNTAITHKTPHPDGAMVTLVCASRFSKEWITKHYLADLNRWWAEVTANDARVTGMELIMEGESCKNGQ
ncbi:MAG: DnaA N-terminal domain-containing protein [Rickettsiales bacterium]